ncbi:MAG: ABC-F family ATP-binding cassette domain-containing protein [Clostridia bacterium]|nr:ABC-F family ATP-binding cassette domain-containing protein [Clostridia bacterium]
MICISASEITKSYGIVTLLDKVSFSLNYGDRLGIVGDNGAGKSTLLKIIAGELEATSGKVSIPKDLTVGMLSQNPVINSENSLYDEALSVFGDLIKLESEIEELRKKAETGDIESSSRYSKAMDEYERLGGYEYKSRTKGILINLGFDEEDQKRRVCDFSGGQKTRICLASLLLSNPDILILDEPTNHLDISALNWLEDYLKNYKKTVIAVSHDRFFLDGVATKILELEYKKGRIWNGNYTAFAQAKKKDREVLQHHYDIQQREIKRIEEYIAQQRRWNRERNIIAAESRQKQLDKLVKIDKPKAPTDNIRLSFAYFGESGNEVLNLRNVTKAFGNNILFSNVNALIKKKERIFITGENGCGKSTLMKILAGNLRSDSGFVEWGANVKVGYYDQENQNLNSENTVVDELWESAPDLTNTEVRNALALLLFKGDDVIKKVSVLSGGEKARLTLAKLMQKKVNVLLLDEPTNHLDISSREVLETAIQNFEGTVIAVSHDRYFTNKLATRILYFNNKEILSFDGAYYEYRTFAASKTKTEKTNIPHTVTQSKKDYIDSKKALSEKRKLENAVIRAKKKSEEIENRLSEIDIEVQESSSDHVKLSELYDEQSKLEEDLLSQYEIIENCEEELRKYL